MSTILKLKNFFLGRPHLLDDFELKLVDHLAEALSAKNRDILQSQMHKFNMVQRGNEIDDTEKRETYLYWKEWGKIRRDFPKLFPSTKQEEKIAKMRVESNVGIIDVSFWIIDGAFFSIEFLSKSGIFRPLDPDFKIIDTKILIEN